ncbi:MAG TPA: PAS domain S-box protein [Smithella sp.]|nr:PAS domain S-box protein [Smithella sp.]
MTKCLIVDDNRANLYLLKNLMQSKGWEVIEAENGKIALDKAQAQPPDIIVSDILMPVMDGYALCREWKLDEKLKNIPFVFYTATYTEPKDEKFALDLGADRFIIKPQDPEILMNIIIDLLEEKKGAKPLAVKPLGEEMEFFRRYNETLFGKLEKKVLDLETSNRKIAAMEDTYRLSFENASDVIYTIDTSLNILSVSPSVEKILGYTPRDFVGRSVLDMAYILTPESYEKAVAHISRVLNGETIPAELYEFVAKDGTIKIVEISGAPIIHDGRVTGLISVGRDITLRKKAEEELRKEKSFNQTLIQHSPTFFVAINSRGETILMNNALLSALGYTKGDVEGRNYMATFVPEVERESLSKIFEQLIQNNKPTLNVNHILAKDGSQLLVEWYGQPVFKESGEFDYFFGVGIDITKRRQAEDALRESEIKYRGILESLDDAYFELDLKGNLVFFNETFMQRTGYSREELMGMNYRKYVSPDSWEKASGIYSKIFTTGKPDRNFSYEIIMKNGQKRYFESWSDLLIDKNRQPVGFRGMARDITERRLAEEKLKQTLESLRNAVGTTIQVMVSAVEMRDPYTAGHQIRSADLARAIALEMELPQEKIDGIRMVGSIHDIGKLSVPSEILSKPTTLTEIEYSLIKEHPRSGYEMLKDVESPWPLAEIVYQHHERMNGSGYPRGLKGDEILMEARILAVADVVEAMASHRPYRPSLGIDAALEEIEKNKRILYDSAVADACLKLFREKNYQLK